MSRVLHSRHLQTRLRHALEDTPVVCLTGASRTGKTTLVLALQAGLAGAAYCACRDPLIRGRAAADPAGFLEALPGLALLDDVDLVPGLLPALKAAVDRGRRFLLGSSRPLVGLAQDLGSGLESFSLWPLAQAERQGLVPGLIDACFAGDPARLRLERLDRPERLNRILAGGYPELEALGQAARERWLHDYLDALVRGVLRDLTELREVHHLTRLLAAPAANPGQHQRCLELLTGLQVMAALPAGPGSPYRCFNDSALQAHLLGMAPAALETRPVLLAPLLETFAIMELVKTAPWSQARPALSVQRGAGQTLVLLENHRREWVAFTTVASATVPAEAFQGLRALRAKLGERLRAGIVLHAGAEPMTAGPGLWALPLQALWA